MPPPAGATPCAFIFSTTSGAWSTLLTSAFRRSTIGRGVPAGAKSPSQTTTSTPGWPDSAKVGVEGSAGDRFPEVTATAFSLPLFTRLSTDATDMIATSTCPPMTSVSAGAAGL